jgi:hypothetical protein
MSPYLKAMDSQFDFGLYYHNLEYNYLKKQGMNAALMLKKEIAQKPLVARIAVTISVVPSLLITMS